MKAFSRSDAGALAAGALTVVLGIFFWFPTGPRSVGLMPPVSLEGRKWVLNDTTPPVPEPEPRAAAAAQQNRTAPQKAPSTEPRQKSRRRGLGRTMAGGSTTPTMPRVTTVTLSTTAVSADGRVNSTVAASVVAPPWTLDRLQKYAAQDIIDSFESDPSKYPLDRAVKSDGIALALEGLQRRGRLYVLKVAVANNTAADFFIEGFSVRAGTVILDSRSLFRILVEPQRVREGYVVFEKPPLGAAVHVTLKEDGGQGRSLDTVVPYPF